MSFDIRRTLLYSRHVLRSGKILTRTNTILGVVGSEIWQSRDAVITVSQKLDPQTVVLFTEPIEAPE
ncbi:hypothetical protein RvY_10624 [Ramazzottius varieornatus]|uniref:Uncharacterized protein n=1 Tax=Ramazzottius varieornatus TaxID=947166 RepID=A0A1D1VDD1_RAMVA|nr:hypothetical protein RvY_10624 [Ramazzottius varieornatus]